jgi:hypothetical protein
MNAFIFLRFLTEIVERINSYLKETDSTSVHLPELKKSKHMADFNKALVKPSQAESPPVGDLEKSEIGFYCILRVSVR